MRVNVTEAEERLYFDAIIVVPLEEEFEVALEQFTDVKDLTNETTIKFSARLSGTNAHFLLVKQSLMGKAANYEAFYESLVKYDTGLLICVGIAAAISSDVVIGDVCYSGSIIDVQENAKVTEKTNGTEGISLCSKAYYTPREVSIPIARDRISPATKPGHMDWAQDRLRQAQKLIPHEFSGRGEIRERIVAPTVREGAIVCGLVSASPTYNAKLRAIDRKILALETESGGMSAIAEQRSIAALSVRGISDYAGIDKNRFEEETGNKARHVAALNALSFLRKQFSSPFMADYFERMRGRRSVNSGQLELMSATPPDRVAALLLRLVDESAEKLRDLAPGYDLQARGYRLPVPRLRMQGRTDLAGEPIEIRNAIRDARVLMLHVSREYPDYSLAWIISNDLVTLELNNKQTVPCVIEAKNLQRPRRGISELAGQEFVEIEKTAVASTVYIIDDVVFETRSKVEFLKMQIEAHPTAKFIVLTRYAADADAVSEFARSTAAASAKICEISFSEISHFVQKNFEMTPSASEVIAMRLRETFSKYRRSAHPSYFAGVPKDVLNALLQANRRAELIEIAVVGYLTFVVVHDQEAISLSRKTRQAFLEELAFEINMRARSFTEVDVIHFAGQFAQKYDFSIAPVRFVAAFMEKGILHIESGYIRFTLPFMESYLLASKLRATTDADVLEYFSIAKSEFDYRTFSLYAEMGPSANVVSNIMTSLEQCISSLKRLSSGKSVLLDNSVVPKLLDRPDRLKSIQNRLQKAEEDVRNDRDQSHAKQRLLDASDRVKETAAAKLSEAQQNSGLRSGTDNQPSLQSRATTLWLIALNLLGSGAERLEADTKRLLVTRVVSLTSQIINGLTRGMGKLDLKTLESELIGSLGFVSGIAKSSSDDDMREARKLISSMLEYFEFIISVYPFIYAMGAVCEEARANVLAESIRKIRVEDEAEDLIRQLWLSDINMAQGKSDLLRVVRKLPKN